MSQKEMAPYRTYLMTALIGAGILAAPLYAQYVMASAEQSTAQVQKELALQDRTENSSQ